MPDLMTAAYVTELGPVENILVGAVPVPPRGPADVLVAVAASAVDPVDTLVRAGTYATPVPLPLVLGRDLVGTVVDAPSSTGFGLGERVWCNSLGHAGRQGAAAQYAVVPADRLYRLPDDVDPFTAVAVVHPAATAYLGLVVHAGVRPGQAVFVGGGAGNVGRAAVAMAALGGARVLASARRADHDECRRLGADVVLDFTSPTFGAELLDAVPGGVDVFWETSGHHDLTLAARATRPGGRVVLTAAGAGEAGLPVREVYTRGVALLGVVISRAAATDLADAAGLVNAMLATGRLDVRGLEVLPLADAAAAHRRIEHGEVRGRLVLEVAGS